ncbi:MULTISPECIES: hypothetical protein [Bradyrhizobium]|uniref:hypothetical protein n=1 Tax=Bradyrhizobium TaxID=374 RepID=UPI001E388922|nr:MULTISPECIES: hypothetical protein [Bradyrhizobium]UFW46292.1 hypothetical protein BaraCB756_28735 [Bradyrhizobium arachidis]
MICIRYLLLARGCRIFSSLRFRIAVMTEQLNLEDWAWQLSTEVYRLNLYSHLTRQAEPNRSSVTEEELAGAIRDSFTQVNEAAYREMVKLATEAALETYDRVVSSTIKRSRVRLCS